MILLYEWRTGRSSDSSCFSAVSEHLSFLSSEIAEKSVLLTEAQIHCGELILSSTSTGAEPGV